MKTKTKPEIPPVGCKARKEEKTMTKKKLKVKDILALMTDNSKANVVFYAYGIYYGSALADGMETVKDCKEQLRYDCLNAVVTSLSIES